MNCAVCGTWLSGTGGGWVHHARAHVREGKIKESISEVTSNYVFHYKRGGAPVEPWRGGQTWEERQAVKRNTRKPRQKDSKERAALTKEMYAKAKKYVAMPWISRRADLLDLAAIIAVSKADALAEFKFIERHRERAVLLRKVARGLRREATIERRKT